LPRTALRPVSSGLAKRRYKISHPRTIMPTERTDRIKTILADLVGFDTVSHKSNLPLVDHVEAYLATHGVRARRIVDETGRKAALWVTIGPADRPGIVLSGHTDVVPVEGQEWSSDPFTLREQDGKLFGRGSADMKGFVAVCLAMVPEMTSAKLAAPIHLALSYDEEVGCVGVRPLLDEVNKLPVKPLACFVGEPTLMQVAIGHKGKHALRAIVQGLACHSSLAPQGVNAVEYAADLIVEVRRRAEHIAASGQRDELYDIPYTTLLTSIVHGGTALNIVPEACELQFEARGLGVHEAKQVTDEIVAWTKTKLEPAMQARHADSGIEFEEILEYPALDMAADDPLVTFAKTLAGKNSHIKVSFGTEAGLFVATSDIPSVVIGPGAIAQAHRPDEFVEIAELERCAGMIEKLVARCVEPNGLDELRRA
jgi:acetylornithine deacetylase